MYYQIIFLKWPGIMESFRRSLLENKWLATTVNSSSVTWKFVSSLPRYSCACCIGTKHLLKQCWTSSLLPFWFSQHFAAQKWPFACQWNHVQLVRSSVAVNSFALSCDRPANHQPGFRVKRSISSQSHESTSCDSKKLHRKIWISPAMASTGLVRASRGNFLLLLLHEFEQH